MFLCHKDVPMSQYFWVICWDGSVPPWARALSVSCSQRSNELCYFVLLVHFGVFVASRPENVSLFWNYLMGIFPVSDVVKFVLLFFGTASPCYLSEYFCDTRGAFLRLVLRVCSGHSLCVLPVPQRRDIFCHICKAWSHWQQCAPLWGTQWLRPWFASQAFC